MARRSIRKTLKSGPVHRWATARLYMGLTQACRLLRHEFRPLYMGALRYSTSLDNLAEVIELVELREMKRDIGTILDDLEQWPLPARGIDLLQFFNIIQSQSEKMNVHGIGYPVDYPYDIPSYLPGFWMRMRGYMTEFTSRIPHLRLLSKPDSHPSSAMDDLEHLLQITIPPMDDKSRNQREADSYVWRFVRSVHLEIKDCTVECHRGDDRFTSQITSQRDKGNPRYFSKRIMGYGARR
ncbi:hypothetical protein HBI65_117410 [Parastagonospora nodorum]|nr:hypothetical protein HBI65_117410 [Parastagonospora nodorum]